MATRSPFNFQAGNLSKLLAIPTYLLGMIASWFVPRSVNRWVFGSAIGPTEGALEVARTLKWRSPEAVITWVVADDFEAGLAASEGFETVTRGSLRSFWATLRAGVIIVTHGFGDVNRFGVFGGKVVNLWHGPPLKKLHLDSQVTTHLSGPRVLRGILERMYRAGTKRLQLITVGSAPAAARLRTAFRVQPGTVQVTGDARLDELARQLRDRNLLATARNRIVQAAGINAETANRPIVLYAPTWRDGEEDPAVPTDEEALQIVEWAARERVHLIVRPHPLGHGSYDAIATESKWVHELPATNLRDLTNVLAAFDLVITDYSSTAIDFSLTSKPIVWFAPDLKHYANTRGLYEPYEITTEGHWSETWHHTLTRVSAMLDPTQPARRAAVLRSQRLAERFHTHPEGGAANRVLDLIDIMLRPREWATETPSVLFESFYGRLATCNPRALDETIAREHPEIRRLWSVENELVIVPEGATPVLIGGPQWRAARAHAPLIIVNDWLRFHHRRPRHQFILQTWHGTPLKRLALDRTGTSLRTRMAIRRESRRWSALLSQNPHSTETLTRSYAFKGEVIETGYPRNDRLALSVAAGERLDISRRTAREKLGLAHDKRVLLYAPTWRDGARTTVDLVDIDRLAELLGDEWLILARGHSRTMTHGGYRTSPGHIIDVTRVPDVNDLIIAADLFVTDYSSLMFDVSVARVPTVFFVPDLEHYETADRGFTLPFHSIAPGPFITDTQELAQLANDSAWQADYYERAEAWRVRFNPYDDGRAATRVVQRLREVGAIPQVSSDARSVDRLS